MKCKNCKESFERIRQNQIVCSIECAYQLQSKAKDKKDKAETKAKKIKLKTYTQKVNDAKKVFQKWIRNRDTGLPCISCGCSLSGGVYHAGHYKKSEIYRGVIFNEFNVNGQCIKCNLYLDGNESNYRSGLVKKIGEQKVIELEELAEQTRKYKYSDAELEEIKKKYK
jgi:hypothetical protein